MPGLPQTGWMVVLAAAAVVVLFVVVEWVRYAFRSLRLAHLLAKSRREDLPAARPSVAVRVHSPEIPRAAAPPVPGRRVPIPPEVAIDVRK